MFFKGEIGEYIYRLKNRFFLLIFSSNYEVLKLIMLKMILCKDLCSKLYNLLLLFFFGILKNLIKF